MAPRVWGLDLDPWGGLDEWDLDPEVWALGPDTEEVAIDALNRMKSCFPAGVTYDSEIDSHKIMDCERYSVCPWCRFRKAKQIMKSLDACRADAKQLAYIKLTAPVMLMPSHEDYIQSYKAVINSICKKRPLFFADYVVTVPNWRAVSYGDDLDFTFNFETTIIGLSHEPTELPLPEDCLSPEMRQRAVFGSDGSGGWTVGRPTLKMLAQAMRTAMGFSPGLLTPHVNPIEFRIASSLQSRFRAVAHGAARGL